MLNRTLLSAVLAVFPFALVQGSDKQPGVGVVHRCDHDPVGLQIVYEARQLLASSRTLQLDENAPLYLSLNCLDPLTQDRGRESQMSYSVLFLWPGWEFPVVLVSGVQRVGKDRVSDAARSLVAQADASVPGVRRFIAQSGVLGSSNK